MGIDESLQKSGRLGAVLVEEEGEAREEERVAQDEFEVVDGEETVGEKLEVGEGGSRRRGFEVVRARSILTRGISRVGLGGIGKGVWVAIGGGIVKDRVVGVGLAGVHGLRSSLEETSVLVVNGGRVGRSDGLVVVEVGEMRKRTVVGNDVQAGMVGELGFGMGGPLGGDGEAVQIGVSSLGMIGRDAWTRERVTRHASRRGTGGELGVEFKRSRGGATSWSLVVMMMIGLGRDRRGTKSGRLSRLAG